ncbi:alpha/beta hydrolase [Tomitella cavernea]|uniref:Alpha/beta hydrolase n=1 Tax=Tomitella cavernea TaxID=1387982 RepID=A0ABP9CPM1_9ACTN|nr:alpha/beta hydrolase [Tomitella cavernea]
MANGYLIRQAAAAAVAADVLAPPKEMATSVLAMFGGWLGAELAPHALAALAVDNAQHLLRHGLRGGADKAGLALGAAAAAGFGASLAISRRAGGAVQDAFEADLPDADRALLDEIPAVDTAIPCRALVNPFRMARPGVVRRRNLTYGDGSKRTRLNVYSRSDSPGGAPILLQIHGGGWVIGNKDQQGIPLMEEMASRGWVCAAVNYPLSPRARWPEHLIAVKKAVAWLRANAADLGADPEFIAVTGGSAGGHLTAMTALTGHDTDLQPGFEDQDVEVQAAVPMYGVYDFAAETGIRATTKRVHSPLSPIVLGRGAQFPDAYRAASPLAHLTDDAPPFLVVHGSNDVFIPAQEARIFAEKLRAESRQPVVYAEIPGAQHAFDVFPSVRTVAVVRQAARFLEWSLLRSGRALPSR